MNKERIFLIGSAAVILLILNGLIAQKVALIQDGQTMLLELAPKDPRSLMQGDYLQMDYRLDITLRSTLLAGPHQGRVVVRLDKRQVAQVLRRFSGETLGAGEYLLVYRHNRWSINLGSDAFFIQEGQAGLYSDARYGVLKVADNGASVLVGLRDSHFMPLGPGN